MEMTDILHEGKEVVLDENEDNLGIGPEMRGWDKKKNGPKKVLFTVYLREIYTVDSAGETFKPLVDFCFDWVDDGALKKEDADKANYWSGGYQLKEDPEKHFTPGPHCVNAISDAEPIEDTTSVSLLRGRPVVSQYYSISPELRSPMDVRNFPFDSQDLEVRVSSSWFTSDLNFVYDGDVSDPRKLVDTCIDPIVTRNNEYDITGVIIETEEHRYENLTRYDHQNEGYSEIVTKFQVARNPVYYLRGIFMVLNLVLLIGATCFWLDPSDDGTRFSISTTMFLTLVAFHFVALGSLPKVSYSTRLDKWMSVCYALLFLSNIENLLMYNLSAANADFCSAHCSLIDRCLFGAYLFVLLVNDIWFVMPYFFRKKGIRKALKKVKKI